MSKNISIRDLLKTRNFSLLWAGQATSMLGDNLNSIAIMWLVLELTGSTLKMATFVLCSTVPSIILAPIAGGYVDRWDRRRTMISSDLIRGILIAFLPTVLKIGVLHIWHIYIIIALMSSVSTFFGPALSASIPLLVMEKQIVRANAFLQGTGQVCSIIGMAAGGIIVGFISIPFAMYIDSISFFISALAIFAIVIPKSPLSTIQKRAEIWTDIKEGFRYVVSEKPLLWLMILVPCINFTLSPIVILLPKFTKDILGAGPKAYSVILAAMSVGGLISSSLLSIIGDIKRKGFWILSALFGLGVANVLFAFSPSVTYATLMMAIAGIMVTPAGTLAVSIFQTTVPNEKQGRVFGLMGAMGNGLRPISIALVGALGDVFSARLILASGGCLLILIVLCAYLFSQIKSI